MSMCKSGLDYKSSLDANRNWVSVLCMALHGRCTAVPTSFGQATLLRTMVAYMRSLPRKQESVGIFQIHGLKGVLKTTLRCTGIMMRKRIDFGMDCHHDEQTKVLGFGLARETPCKSFGALEGS
ncbi:hypothetical protein L1987_15728 [Smallanthus sonchifolius]|uniref:Uncharacterized protein n=1 Tax=Smallanthus sonchifolius TaxID=185202 RepID=A0ACB9J7X4_9ASTR|nr:hypothetical protein L1987_15728 [Smallanthus sonchifolius]